MYQKNFSPVGIRYRLLGTHPKSNIFTKKRQVFIFKLDSQLFRLFSFVFPKSCPSLHFRLDIFHDDGARRLLNSLWGNWRRQRKVGEGARYTRSHLLPAG